MRVLPLLLLTAATAWSNSQPCFVPGQNCEQRIIDHIAAAAQSLEVQGYILSDTKIVDAIIAAKNRNVDVQVLLDRNWRRFSLAAVNQLRQNAVSVLIDSAHPIAHNKVIVIDHLIVFTGSYNFSVSAARYNAENSVMIVDEPDVVEKFESNFRSHRLHCTQP